MGKKTSFYLSSEFCEKFYVAPWARKPMEAVNKISERYFYFISYEKKKIQQIFSEDELFFMCMVCKTENWTPAEKLYDGVLRVVDSFENDFYALSSLSKTQLEEKLRSLSVLQQFALVDYIEEYWYKHDDLKNIEEACKSEVSEKPSINDGDTRTAQQIVADACAAIKASKTFIT